MESDLKKLFENAPEGAVAIRKTAQGKMFFENNKGEYYHGSWKSSFCDKWVIVATRPQPEHRKTVEDVVDAFGGKWPNSRFNLAWYNSERNEILLGCNHTEDTICTRKEFEVCVAAKDKSEPEWTHTLHGEKCKIITTEKDAFGMICCLYENEMDYAVTEPTDLKPIKPTITEKERETVAKFVARIYTKDDCDLRKEFDDFISEHEVVG